MPPQLTNGIAAGFCISLVWAQLSVDQFRKALPGEAISVIVAEPNQAFTVVAGGAIPPIPQNPPTYLPFRAVKGHSLAHDPAAGAVVEWAGREAANEVPGSLPTQRIALEMSVVVVKSVAELAPHLEQWEDLAANAAEPNIFYEPWMLNAALNAFSEGLDLNVVLVFGSTESKEPADQVLCGLFPFVLNRDYKGLPLASLVLWKYEYCFLCTPLVRAGYEQQSIEAVFNWVDESKEAGLIEFNSVAGDGPVHRALTEALSLCQVRTFVLDEYDRAVFRPDQDATAYLKAALAKTHRKDINRRRRRLADMGEIEFVQLAPEGDIDRWIRDFLAMESAGWKGRNGTALGSSPPDRQFFIDTATEAFRQGRLFMLALLHNGEPIAMKCSFTAGAGSFAFKIAFEESHAAYSPGVLLEIENIERLHREPAIEWMDSCAVRDHFMINRLWPARRSIRSTLVSTNSTSGNIVVAMLPWFRRLAGSVRGLSARITAIVPTGTSSNKGDSHADTTND